ncbi:MAG: family 10 glycosylhydrolase [Firmicutes bacterium]|nr:family 10 glycosylhydrolase [Bacillota bacterium]
MRRFFRTALFFSGILILLISTGFSIRADEVPPEIKPQVRPEVRALWVDAFRDGAKTPAQIDQLIQDALAGNINTLLVQVRRRGDAYYNRSVEPRTEDPALPPEFDALQYLIDKAHANHIEVHAWLNSLVAWNSPAPPKDPGHIWNLHGPQAKGRENWVSYYRNKSGQKWADTLHYSYFLDPGHPDVVDHTVAVCLNVVRNYDVDGIHLDYTRYDGMGFGYNPTNVARYNAVYGTTGLPAPEDPGWAQWRRDQTANLVRKIYLKSIALKPQLKVSSAVIAWGDGPVAEDDWLNSRAYANVFQDWRQWLAEGILDLAFPMNYFSEWDPNQASWYNHWIEWEKNHQYNRQTVIGPAIYAQYIEQSLEQIRRALSPSALGNRPAGVALYAYGASHLYSANDFKEAKASKNLPRQPHVYLPEANGWFFGLLSKSGGYFDPVLHTEIPTRPVFPAPAPLPEMPWKSSPAKGSLMGTVVDQNGQPYDHLKVTVDGWLTINPETSNSNPEKAGVHREVYTDGSGWFGLAELPPGFYRITINSPLVKTPIQALTQAPTPAFPQAEDQRAPGARVKEVVIQAGQVTEVDL